MNKKEKIEIEFLLKEIEKKLVSLYKPNDSDVDETCGCVSLFFDDITKINNTSLSSTDINSFVEDLVLLNSGYHVDIIGFNYFKNSIFSINIIISKD